MSDLLERLKTALADRYTVERELGSGGMAVVYLARDLRHERPVAIKVLRPELSSLLGAERFLREIKIEARLQHPNILPLHDSGGSGSLLYYVMPYVEGESLRNRLDRHGVTVITVKPGPVRTEMTEKVEKMPMAIEADQAADRIFAAIAARTQVAYVPFQWMPIMTVIKSIPSVIFRRLSI